MGTESVRVNKDVMNKLRKHIVGKENGGRLYGKITDTIEKAIKEYLYREELYGQIETEKLEDKVIILEIEVAKLRAVIGEIHRLSEQSSNEGINDNK